MCLAIPVKIKQLLDNDMARVDLNGIETQISTALVDDIKEGDYVILHVGYALSKLDEDEARETLRLFDLDKGES